MSKREQDDRIEKLKSQGVNLYSISKLNAIDGCLLEAYYTYRADPRPIGEKNIYGIMGTRIHDTLEKIYNCESSNDELLTALKDELAEADMIGVDFPKDFKGGTSIRDNWIADMADFCREFEKWDGDFHTEELVVLKVNDKRYLRGYVDLIQIVDEETKTIDIYDFKTSSKFKKSDLKHHGRQLVVYGLAKAQEGFKVRRLAWIMLKYLKVQFDGYARSNSKNKSKIEKVVRRGALGKELAPYVEKMMYERGYDDITTEITLDSFIESNSMESLPEEIRDQFTVEQYIEEYPFTEEVQREALDYIHTQADKFEALWDKPMEEWTPVHIDEKQSFYCANLCSHRNICPELRKYNMLRDLMNTDDEDLF